MTSVEPLHPVAPPSKPGLTSEFSTVGGTTGTVSTREYSSRFGEPDPRPVTTPVLAEVRSASATEAGDAEGKAWRYSAAAPATCGVAIEVPLRVLVARFPVFQAEVIPEPGANRSTHV